MGQSKYPYVEFSGALQQITTPHIRKTNEVDDAKNVNFSKVIGSFVRRDGAQKYDSSLYPTIPTSPIDKPTLGGYIARFSTGAEIWMASNVSGNATSRVRRWDVPTTAWVDVATGLLPDAEVNFEYDLKEVWVSSYVKSTDTIGTPFTVDKTHDVSQTRQLAFAPAARFYMEFNGSMWAANVAIGGTRYRDRLYKSSGPSGVVAFSRSAQTDVAAAVTLLDNVPTMTSASTPSGVVATSTADGSHPGYFAFDDDPTTYFLTASGNTTGNISYDFGSGVTKIIAYYSIVGIYASEVTVNLGPKTWTFEGSNNGSSWTTLDTQTTVPAWTAGEKRIYTISNTTAYRYYRVNVSANQGNGTFLEIAEIELLTSTTGVKALTLNLDSARYTKPSEIFDVYTAGTNNKLFSITVLDVDKINDSITYLPYQLNFATTDVNTTTEVITLSSTTSFPTGTPIRFTSTGGVPAGLVANTTYYAINASGTTIKVATSLTNAQLGVAINLTSQGTGVHTILLSYAIGNKDELWLPGRKGLLTRLWNVDYRDPTSADWLELPATIDATNDITAVGKISSRMFIFTENSMFKYDSQNLTPLYNDVGCIAMQSVCYYQSFMIWLDAKGQVWARNEEAGTQDILSTPIQKTLALVTQSSLTGATAVCVGKKYKLTLGQVTFASGTVKTLRVVYDFEANTWTTEWFDPQMLIQLEYKYAGNIQPHFFDEHGNFWVDELGDDDAGTAIPLDVSIGDDNLQNDQIKKFLGVKIYGKNAVGTKILAYVDGQKDPIELGEMRRNIASIPFPKDTPEGTMVNLRFTNSEPGSAAEIQKAIVYFNAEEDTFRESNTEQ